MTELSNEELMMKFLKGAHEWEDITSDPPDGLLSDYELLHKKKLTGDIPSLYK